MSSAPCPSPLRRLSAPCRTPICTTSIQSLTRDWRSTEYLALVGSFVLVGLEAIIRVLTLALRKCGRVPVWRSAI